MPESVPRWYELLLQELLDFVHVDLDLPVEGHEWWVSAWREVLQVSWFPAWVMNLKSAGITAPFPSQ